MAKKKQSKEIADAAPAGEPAIDRAYAIGNYAGVRALASSDTSEHAKKLLALVAIDQVQVLIGVGALFVVALGAFLTLR